MKNFQYIWMLKLLCKNLDYNCCGLQIYDRGRILGHVVIALHLLVFECIRIAALAPATSLLICF